jgi:Tfp pilus tip-associated adhesin PilY1
MSEEQLSRYSHEDVEEDVKSSSGIFCWSSSSSSSKSKRSERETFTSAASDGLIIRIPGPQVCLLKLSLTYKYLNYVMQILGYMLQYVDNDLTQDLPSTLSDDFLIADADYEAGFNKTFNSTGFNNTFNGTGFTSTGFIDINDPSKALVPPVADSSTTTAVSAPKEKPAHSSGFYPAPKARA